MRRAACGVEGALLAVRWAGFGGVLRVVRRARGGGVAAWLDAVDTNGVLAVS